MPLTLAQFVDRFPEFADASPTLVQANLDDAAIRTPADVWGTLEPAAHGWLAAHLIALSAFGRDAHMVNVDGSTSYGRQRARMDAERGPGATPRVTGGAAAGWPWI